MHVAQALRIEMVLPTLEAAGMEVVTARLARALAKRGHDVGITCIERGGALMDELQSEGHRVSIVPAPGVRSNLRAARLQAWLRHRRPDVVHVHSGAWLKTARAARSVSVPRVVFTEHGLLDPEPWYNPTLKRWAAGYTDWVVSVSAPLRDYLVREVGLNPKKVRVVPNGVDTVRFQPGARSGALRSRLKLGDERLVIGNVARLEPVKNHTLLLQAFALLHSQVPAVTLVIVGEGSQRQRLEWQVSELGLESCVHLLGTSMDVAAIYRDLDLFVLSSKAEGTPMSVLEAMASGISVVATAVGGVPDLLGQGQFGWLVSDANDPAALGDAMAEAMRDSDRRRRIAATARAHVVSEYSQDAMLDAYEQLYWQHPTREVGADDRVATAH